MLGDVKPKSPSFRENRKSHIISAGSVMSVGLRKFTGWFRCSKISKEPCVCLCSSMVEPWIFPRDIGSNPTQGTETM